MASLKGTESRLTECPICHEEFKRPKLLPCSHSYCLDCIIKLAGKYLRQLLITQESQHKNLVFSILLAVLRIV